MIYRTEKIDAGYRYWWPARDDVRDWLKANKISFEEYPHEQEIMHDVFDGRTAVLIKLVWGGA